MHVVLASQHFAFGCWAAAINQQTTHAKSLHNHQVKRQNENANKEMEIIIAK